MRAEVRVWTSQPSAACSRRAHCTSRYARQEPGTRSRIDPENPGRTPQLANGRHQAAVSHSGLFRPGASYACARTFPDGPSGNETASTGYQRAHDGRAVVGRDWGRRRNGCGDAPLLSLCWISSQVGDRTTRGIAPVAGNRGCDRRSTGRDARAGSAVLRGATTGR